MDIAQKIWTVGHSTLEISKFLDLLKSQEIEAIADVRAYPSSKKFPQYNGGELSISLHNHHINYRHFPGLGGKRKPKPESRNAAWKNESFRGYADYMETPAFSEEAARLISFAADQRTAVMCAEALWWKCHRALISDYLKASGIEVIHILSNKKIQPHRFSGPAIVNGGKLSYAGLGF